MEAERGWLARTGQWREPSRAESRVSLSLSSAGPERIDVSVCGCQRPVGPLTTAQDGRVVGSFPARLCALLSFLKKKQATSYLRPSSTYCRVISCLVQSIRNTVCGALNLHIRKDRCDDRESAAAGKSPPKNRKNDTFLLTVEKVVKTASAVERIRTIRHPGVAVASPDTAEFAASAAAVQFGQQFHQQPL